MTPIPTIATILIVLSFAATRQLAPDFRQVKQQRLINFPGGMLIEIEATMKKAPRPRPGRWLRRTAQCLRRRSLLDRASLDRASLDRSPGVMERDTTRRRPAHAETDVTVGASRRDSDDFDEPAPWDRDTRPPVCQRLGPPVRERVEHDQGVPFPFSLLFFGWPK